MIIFQFIFCSTKSSKHEENIKMYFLFSVKFRYYLHSSSAIFIFFGAVFDFLVWYNGANLELYGDLDEDTKPKKSEKNKTKDDSPESEPLNK